MANHPSAEKRHRQNVKRRARNRHHTSAMRTTVKTVTSALAAKDPKAARAALKGAISTVAKTAQKGVIKAKTASRKIARLTRAVHKATTASKSA
jgi:small subunit ribosomal protein S20